MQKTSKGVRYDRRTVTRVLEVILVLGVIPVLVQGAMSLNSVSVV